MAKGGARARSGPAPDPNALRRDRPSDQGSWTLLPAAGREGAVPEWPLADQTQREAVLWAREWVRPQAVMWERAGQECEVAMYVRCFALAESMTASVAARTLVRQQQEALGLSQPGLLRLRWRIADVEAAEEDGPKRRVAAAGASARSRFKVVEG